MIIDIPENKKIGVMVSGGIDSAILWYLVYSECVKRGQECIAFTGPKLDSSVPHSTSVLEYVADEIGGDVREPIVLGGPAIPGEEDIWVSLRCLKAVVDNHLADIIYGGENLWPSDEVKREFEPDETSWPYRPRTGEEGSYKIYDRLITHEGSTTEGFIPFRDLTKDETMNILVEMGKSDVLRELGRRTRSCILPPENLGHPGRCNFCFWCKERAWAFNRAGVEDLGV